MVGDVMSLVTNSFLLHIPRILQVIFLSIMPALWIAHENKTKKDATLIHTTLASALMIHLIKKKDVPNHLVKSVLWHQALDAWKAGQVYKTVIYKWLFDILDKIYK